MNTGSEASAPATDTTTEEAVPAEETEAEEAYKTKFKAYAMDGMLDAVSI